MTDEQNDSASDQSTPRPATRRKLRVFLSYSKPDRERIRQLHRRLSEEGFDPWRDETSIGPGVKWEPAIRKAMRESDAVCVGIYDEHNPNMVADDVRMLQEALEERQVGSRAPGE